MTLEPAACYRAVCARDTRFDGLFFVGVTTTGVYCRPICPARTPGRDRCTFYRRAAEAERDGFRACLRCRPELAPGGAPIESMQRVVRAAIAHIDAGALNHGSFEDLAGTLGVSDRHLRRAIQSELGLSPVDLAQSRRLALAKSLLHDSSLSMTQVAYASGFRSLRRFNSAFLERHGRTPSELRRTCSPMRHTSEATFSLTLDYRPPYAFERILEFIALRAIPGVELVRSDQARGDEYLRTLRIGEHRGFVVIRPHPRRSLGRNALQADVSMSLAPALMALVPRLRRAFDLDAHPAAIDAQLSRDSRLARSVCAVPGMRVPGAFDGFETLVRAVLGQQVSVAAATTLAGRLAVTLGTPIDTPHEGLSRLSPTAEDVRDAPLSQLQALGILQARAVTLQRCADAVTRAGLHLEAGADVEATLAQLLALPGIGPWTAHYVAMRALSWPDAFPDSDLVLRKAMGGLSPRALKEAAEAWRPFRAYAVLHLWNSMPPKPSAAPPRHATRAQPRRASSPKASSAKASSPKASLRKPALRKPSS
jgi:AraC family transcriptional regulator of adaptative response / DNA-3-methyladenine glycosylase II